MSSNSFHKIIFRNSFVNTIRYIINYSIIFFLTPLIINGIGDEQYGLWALVFSVIGYAGLLDLGVQQATIKLVSEYRGKNDTVKLNSIISTTVFYFVFIGFFVSFFCWFIFPYVMKYFLNNFDLLVLSKELLQIIGFDILFVFLSNVFAGINFGMHRYHLNSILEVSIGILRFLATIFVLNSGYGIVGLAYVSLILDIVSSMFLIFICYKSDYSIVISVHNISVSSIKEIFSFGSKIFLASTSMRINTHTTVVVISYFLGTSATAYYNVANRLVGSVQEVLWSFTATLFPVFSELKSSGDNNKVSEYYLQYTRYFLLITIPATIGLLVFGNSFISLWINDDFSQNVRDPLFFLSLSALVAGLQPLSARLMIGGGDVSFYTRVTTLKNLCVLAGSVPLVYFYGISGPPLAILIGEVLYQSAFFVYLVGYFNITYKIYYKKCYQPIIIPVFLIFINFYIIYNLYLNSMYLFMAFMLIVCIIIYLLTVYFFSLIKGEKEYILSCIKKLNYYG